MPSTSATFPDGVSTRIELMRYEPNARGLDPTAQYLAQYIATARTPDGVADRMLAVRDALGRDANGGAAFDRVLDQGQSRAVASPYYDAAGRLHQAFAQNVERGAIDPVDVRGMVDREARFADPGAPEPALGSEHPDVTDRFGRLSSYVDALDKTSTRAGAVREAFVEASLDHATHLRGSGAHVSSHLYAQAANALADLPPANIARHLDGMRRNDPDGVSHFALGALSGEADRAIPRNDPGDPVSTSYRADGLASIIESATVRVRQSEALTGDAHRTNAELFDGATAFLNAARGTALDRSLGDNDAQTRMREALSGAMRETFPAIALSNTMPDGQGLTQNGYDAFTGYSRFEFSAPNDAHGRHTTAEAREIAGQLLGTFHGDLIKARNDHGADLRRDFGAGTFGVHEQTNAARTMGQFLGAIENGIGQDFDLRADRYAHDQQTNRNAFDTIATIAQVAGAVAGERGGVVLDLVDESFSKLSAATPERMTTDTGRIAQLDALGERMQIALATHRPGSDLSTSMQIGIDDAKGQWGDYIRQRSNQTTNDAALGSQQNLLSGLLLRTITPTHPEPVPATAPHLDTTPAILLAKTQEAARAYNADPHHRTPLPVPAATPRNPEPVTEWDRKTHKGGTVLAIGTDEYAYHTGRGNYQIFTTSDTNGVHPVPDMPAVLSADRTIHQDVGGLQALRR